MERNAAKMDKMLSKMERNAAKMSPPLYGPHKHKSLSILDKFSLIGTGYRVLGPGTRYREGKILLSPGKLCTFV